MDALVSLPAPWHKLLRGSEVCGRKPIKVARDRVEAKMPESTAPTSNFASLNPPRSARLHGSGGFNQPATKANRNLGIWNALNLKHVGYSQNYRLLAAMSYILAPDIQGYQNGTQNFVNSLYGSKGGQKLP